MPHFNVAPSRDPLHRLDAEAGKSGNRLVQPPPLVALGQHQPPRMKNERDTRHDLQSIDGEPTTIQTQGDEAEPPLLIPERPPNESDTRKNEHGIHDITLQ